MKENRVKLFLAMIVGESWINHMEPISLIADYYGEKMALFMTFLIHHTGQMIIPSFFGLILQGYHFYYGAMYVSEDNLYYVAKYFESVDQAENFLYIIMLALWSTWYIESWKRKQNTLKYIWAGEARLNDIKTENKRPQDGATWVVERISGAANETVLDRDEWKIFMRTTLTLGFWSIIAFLVWALCMKTQGTLLAMVFKDANVAVFRTLWCITIYSIAVIEFNAAFGKRAAAIVKKENHPYWQDHEEGLIQKSYSLGFLNSYLGMSVAAFYDQKLKGVAMLMFGVLALKQFVMNLRKMIN
jgi:hypothetical protein